MAASILLRHQKEKPFEPAPFGLAIFICGSLPYWVDTNQGVDVGGLFLRPSETGFGAPEPITYQPSKDTGSAETIPIAGIPKNKSVRFADMAELQRGFNLASLDEERWNKIPAIAVLAADSDDSDSDSDEAAVFSPGESSSSGRTPLSSADDSEDEAGSDYWQEKSGNIDACCSGDHVVRRLHPSVDTLRIGIPTAHIYGSKDPYYRQSLELARLCESQWMSTYEHPDGHIVPRDKGVNVKIAATIECTLSMVDVFSR